MNKTYVPQSLYDKKQEKDKFIYIQLEDYFIGLFYSPEQKIYLPLDQEKDEDYLDSGRSILPIAQDKTYWGEIDWFIERAQKDNQIEMKKLIAKKNELLKYCKIENVQELPQS